MKTVSGLLRLEPVNRNALTTCRLAAPAGPLKACLFSKDFKKHCEGAEMITRGLAGAAASPTYDEVLAVADLVFRCGCASPPLLRGQRHNTAQVHHRGTGCVVRQRRDSTPDTWGTALCGCAGGARCASWTPTWRRWSRCWSCSRHCSRPWSTTATGGGAHAQPFKHATAGQDSCRSRMTSAGHTHHFLLEH